MNLRLGKLPAQHDPKDRTIKFRNILNEPVLPPLPTEWDFRLMHPEFNLGPKMWGNDRYGNCVMVASYAQHRDFEVLEQNKLLDVNEDQLVAQYFKESGGVDSGLYMLDHMKVWKNSGLPIGYGRKLLCMKRPLKYKIDAFARIDPKNHKEYQYAIYLTGCNIGVSMPNTYADEFQAGKPWQDTSEDPNPYNGHAMKVMGWNSLGLSLWTWGKEQFAYWDWILKYTDEAWAMIDTMNDWLPDSALDMIKLRQYLDAIDQIS